MTTGELFIILQGLPPNMPIEVKRSNFGNTNEIIDQYEDLDNNCFILEIL